MSFRIFTYALRPTFIKPDLVPLDLWVLCTLVVMYVGVLGVPDPG